MSATDPFAAPEQVKESSLEDQLADAYAALDAINKTGGKGVLVKREGAHAEIDRLEALISGPPEDEPDDA